MGKAKPQDFAQSQNQNLSEETKVSEEQAMSADTDSKVLSTISPGISDPTTPAAINGDRTSLTGKISKPVACQSAGSLKRLGPVPYGLRGKPAELEVVRSIFRQAAAPFGRASMKWILRRLNEKGVHAPGGGKWSRASISWILHNGVYRRVVGPIVFNKANQALRQRCKNGGRNHFKQTDAQVCEPSRHSGSNGNRWSVPSCSAPINVGATVAVTSSTNAVGNADEIKSPSSKFQAGQAATVPAAKESAVRAPVIRANPAQLRRRLESLYSRLIGVPPQQQIKNVRRWTNQRGWLLGPDDFENLPRPCRPGPGLMAAVLVPYLEGTGRFDGASWTFEELLSIISWQYPITRSLALSANAGAIRLCDGLEHRPGLRWVKVNLGANWSGNGGVATASAQQPHLMPHAAILAAAAHFPRWVEAMDGETVPFVWLNGYRVNDRNGQGLLLPNLSIKRQPQPTLALSVGKTDQGLPGYAVPKLCSSQ